MADHYPQLAGEAHFLAGSAHLRLADEPDRRRRPVNASWPDSTSNRRLPRRLRGRSTEAQLPARQGRAARSAATRPRRSALLEKSVEADDPAEGYGLLAVGLYAH